MVLHIHGIQLSFIIFPIRVHCCLVFLVLVAVLLAGAFLETVFPVLAVLVLVEGEGKSWSPSSDSPPENIKDYDNENLPPYVKCVDPLPELKVRSAGTFFLLLVFLLDRPLSSPMLTLSVTSILSPSPEDPSPAPVSPTSSSESSMLGCWVTTSSWISWMVPGANLCCSTGPEVAAPALMMSCMMAGARTACRQLTRNHIQPITWIT